MNSPINISYVAYLHFLILLSGQTCKNIFGQWPIWDPLGRNDRKWVGMTWDLDFGQNKWRQLSDVEEWVLSGFQRGMSLYFQQSSVMREEAVPNELVWINGSSIISLPQSN